MVTTELDIKNYFVVQTTCFRAIGVSITSYDLKRGEFWKFIVSGVAVMLLFITMSWYSFQNAQNMKLFLTAFAPVCEIALISWKTLLCVYKRHEVVRLVRRIHKLSLTAANDEYGILTEENAKDFRFSGFYLMSVGAAAASAILKPVIVCLMVYVKTGEIVLEPTLQGSYPFEQYNRPPRCYGVYIFSVIAIYFPVICTIGVESLYSWYIHNVSAHFRILQLKSDNFSVDTTEQEIKQWVLYHQKCLSLAEDLNQLFSSIMLVQFTFNSVQIVVVAYQIIQDVTLADLPFLLSFLSAITVQPTLYCYGGDRLTTESQNVAMAVFRNIKWNKWPVKYQKFLQFTMMRAQKCCRLNGVFFVINYNLLLWVLRNTASYLTIMKSMKAEGN